MYTITLRERPFVPMTVDEFVAHQESSASHPYTCGFDSSHAPLFIVENVGPMHLACPDCNYEQTAPSRQARPGDVITLLPISPKGRIRQLTLAFNPKRVRQQKGCKITYGWEVKGDLVPLTPPQTESISFKEKIRSVNFGSVK